MNIVYTLKYVSALGHRTVIHRSNLLNMSFDECTLQKILKDERSPLSMCLPSLVR